MFFSFKFNPLESFSFVYYFIFILNKRNIRLIRIIMIKKRNILNPMFIAIALLTLFDLIITTIWFYENSFVGLPGVVRVGVRYSRYFHLAVNWSTVSITSHVQILFSSLVFDSDLIVTAPEIIITLNNPIIALVAKTVFAKRAHFLVI